MGQSESKFVASAIQAIKSGNEVKVRALVGEWKQYIDSQDPKGNSLLKVAVKCNQVAIARMLVEEGADVNAPDMGGVICLHEAVRINNEELVRLLVEKGSYLNGRNDNNETPLMLATMNKTPNILRILLDRHANVNIADSFGNSPLHIAATNGDAEAIQLLLDLGQNVEIDGKNIEGHTPLVLAIKNGQPRTALLLCERGADLSLRSGDGVPPVVAAVSGGHAELLRSMIARGIDLNAQDDANNTPLTSSIENGHQEIARELLVAGASVVPVLPNKCPLHLAVGRGQTVVVESLLQHGADVNFVDNLGDSSLVVATNRGHDGLVSLMIRHSATKENLAAALRLAVKRRHKKIVKIFMEKLDDDDVVQFLIDIGPILDLGEKKEDEKTCVICFENSRNAVAVPCGHNACCADCLETIPNHLCPMCRMPVQIVQRIYHV